MGGEANGWPDWRRNRGNTYTWHDDLLEFVELSGRAVAHIFLAYSQAKIVTIWMGNYTILDNI